MSYVNRRVAESVVEAVSLVLPEAKLFVIEGTEVHKAAVEKGISVVFKVFADRAYTKQGTLVSRKIPGAVIKDPNVAAENIVRMVIDRKAKTIDGELISMKADSVCVHGDTAGALEIVRRVKTRLDEAGVTVAPVGTWHK